MSGKTDRRSITENKSDLITKKEEINNHRIKHPAWKSISSFLFMQTIRQYRFLLL